jgi:glycine cleavage system H protein
MPISGEVIEVNEELNDSPDRVNSDPYGDGWMIKIRADSEESIANLLDSNSYAQEIGS